MKFSLSNGISTSAVRLLFVRLKFIATGLCTEKKVAQMITYGEGIAEGKDM